VGWDTKEDILKNVSVFFVHTLKVSWVQCCFGPKFIVQTKTVKTFFKLYYFVFHRRKKTTQV